MKACCISSQRDQVFTSFVGWNCLLRPFFGFATCSWICCHFILACLVQILCKYTTESAVYPPLPADILTPWAAFITPSNLHWWKLFVEPKLSADILSKAPFTLALRTKFYAHQMRIKLGLAYSHLMCICSDAYPMCIELIHSQRWIGTTFKPDCVIIDSKYAKSHVMDTPSL